MLILLPVIPPITAAAAKMMTAKTPAPYDAAAVAFDALRKHVARFVIASLLNIGPDRLVEEEASLSLRGKLQDPNGTGTGTL